MPPGIPHRPPAAPAAGPTDQLQAVADVHVPAGPQPAPPRDPGPDLPGPLAGRQQQRRHLEPELDALRAVASLLALPTTDPSTHQLLAQVAALTTRVLHGATSASISVGDPAQPADSAADSAEAQAADGVQWRADEGPTADAYRGGLPVLSDDLAADARWPVLAGLAAGSGVRTALAVPLCSGSGTGVLGVLTAYSAAPGGLDHVDDVDRALVLGDAVSAVLEAGHRVEELRSTVDNLRTAMRSRAPIEQAKGVVAARLGCSVDEAFSALSSLSQDRNVKVRDLAALVSSDPAGSDLDHLLSVSLAKVRGRTAERHTG